MTDRCTTKREARRIIRAHWDEYIANADGPPEGAEDVWADENARIAKWLRKGASAQGNEP